MTERKVEEALGPTTGRNDVPEILTGWSMTIRILAACNPF
jgi:hypothetical protein